MTELLLCFGAAIRGADSPSHGAVIVPPHEGDFAMSGQKVAAALEARTADMPPPVSITIDHGSEFTSKALEEWAWRRGVKL